MPTTAFGQPVHSCDTGTRATQTPKNERDKKNGLKRGGEAGGAALATTEV